MALPATMSDEQYIRYRKAQTEPIKILYKMCKDSNLYFVVSGSKSVNYKVKIGNKTIKCTCPDAKNIWVCKHCAHVLQQLNMCPMTDPFWETKLIQSGDALALLKNFKGLPAKQLNE